MQPSVPRIFTKAAHAGIEELAPYQPGKPISELERELGSTDIIKLASNENPMGSSPRVYEAIQQHLRELALYPDGNGYGLKQAIASRYRVQTDQIILGNGSNDILELVGRTFVNPKDEVMYSQYAFAIYPLLTKAIGARGVEVPARDFGHDLPAMLGRITPSTKVIFLANPNNPTGTWFSEAEFRNFMNQVPEWVLVVLDEAYVEYFPDEFNSLPFLEQYKNLVITRTFSKAYGLAALRVGFGLASPQLVNLLNRVRQPFNVNSLALEAATAALGDQDFVRQSRQVNLTGMQQMTAGLDKMGIRYLPSHANFLCIQVSDGQKLGKTVYEAMLKRGIIVRPIAGYGLPDYIRVTIGTTGQNARFLEGLQQVLAELAQDGAVHE